MIHYAESEQGNTIRINGSKDMSEETKAALIELMNAVERGEYTKECDHVGVSETGEEIATHRHGRYVFRVLRCQDCLDGVVEVTESCDNTPLWWLRTTVAPYASNKPELGNAFYYRHEGLNHSTRIVPGLALKK